MVLGTSLAGKFAFYFRERGFGNKEFYRSRNDPSYIEIIDYAFRFNNLGKNLELVVYVPEKLQDSFDKKFKLFRERSFKRNEEGEEVNKGGKYSGHIFLKGIEKINQEIYALSLDFATNNEKRAFRSLLNDVINPLLSFPR